MHRPFSQAVWTYAAYPNVMDTKSLCFSRLDAPRHFAWGLHIHWMHNAARSAFLQPSDSHWVNHWCEPFRSRQEVQPDSWGVKLTSGRHRSFRLKQTNARLSVHETEWGDDITGCRGVDL